MSGKLSGEALAEIRENAERFAANRANATAARSGVDLADGSIFTRVAEQRASLLTHIDALQAENERLRAEVTHWQAQSVAIGSCPGCDFCDPWDQMAPLERGAK